MTERNAERGRSKGKPYRKGEFSVYDEVEALIQGAPITLPEAPIEKPIPIGRKRVTKSVEKTSEEELALIGEQRKMVVAQHNALLNATAHYDMGSRRAAILELETRLQAMEPQPVVVIPEDRNITIERVGNALSKIGGEWEDLTFNYPKKKPEELPALQEKWTPLFSDLLNMDSEGRLIALSRLPRGLRVRDDKGTRSEKNWSSSNQSVRDFFSNTEIGTKMLTLAAFITIGAIIELSGRDLSILEGLKNHIVEGYKKGRYQNNIGGITLPFLLEGINDWFSTE